jgi:anti-sigma regulatory factor (Ser/Thr protein kinase)
VLIKFEDTGREYNPIEQADPDLNKSPSSRDIGGLGIFMVKNIMDDIEYSRDGDKNILIITKNHH